MIQTPVLKRVMSLQFVFCLNELLESATLARPDQLVLKSKAAQVKRKCPPVTGTVWCYDSDTFSLNKFTSFAQVCIYPMLSYIPDCINGLSSWLSWLIEVDQFDWVIKFIIWLVKFSKWLIKLFKRLITLIKWLIKFIIWLIKLIIWLIKLIKWMSGLIEWLIKLIKWLITLIKLIKWLINLIMWLIKLI